MPFSIAIRSQEAISVKHIIRTYTQFGQESRKETRVLAKHRSQFGASEHAHSKHVSIAYLKYIFNLVFRKNMTI